GRLGELKQLLRQRLLLRIPMRCKPIDDVGEAAHRTDFNDLFETEHPGWDARINAVREPLASLLLRLDDRGGVYAGAGAEGVPAEDRILIGQRDAHRVRDELDVLAE